MANIRRINSEILVHNETGSADGSGKVVASVRHKTEHGTALLDRGPQDDCSNETSERLPGVRLGRIWQSERYVVDARIIGAHSVVGPTALLEHDPQILEGSPDVVPHAYEAYILRFNLEICDEKVGNVPLRPLHRVSDG